MKATRTEVATVLKALATRHPCSDVVVRKASGISPELVAAILEWLKIHGLAFQDSPPEGPWLCTSMGYRRSRARNGRSG